MAPIDGDLNVTRENAGEILKRDEFKNLTKEELMILADAKDSSDEKKESKEEYSHLLNKPNMTSTDKENMQKSIIYLEEKGMDTEENFKKLDAINYGSNYIEIGGVKFSREKLVPQVKFNKKPNNYNVFESDTKGVFQTMYNGKEEYYLSTDAYIEESKKQGKKAITHDHIEQALQALPSESYRFGSDGENILGNILNLSISGFVYSHGELGDGEKRGHLGSASIVSTDCTRAFEFDEDKGNLRHGFGRSCARPCLFVVE